MRLPHRRTRIKALHWIVLPFFVWFMLVQPADVGRWGAWWVDLHSVFGLVFVTLSLLWFGEYLRHGLLSRPGPKLRGPLRPAHRWLHLVLVCGLFAVVVGGFLLGLTSSRLLWAGDVVPIAPPLGLPALNDMVGLFHEVQFYALGAVAALHAGFHLWRHLHLRDNALRIMAPKALHRFL